MQIYNSHKELELPQLISYSLRKWQDVKYQKYNKTANAYEDPVSMGIHPYKCECTGKYFAPDCTSTLKGSKYVIDWICKQPIWIQECPRRFDDTKLWQNIYIVLGKIKDWDQIYSYYGIPAIQLPTHLYDFIEEVFKAKARYLNQRDDKER